jgi:DNA repair exonuclease SbcCD ATPase subunit/DNA repair exonuclease SbcCD nuclease subunit
MRFAHIADTHIKNLKYHKEYKAVFKQLYASLKEREVDYIIHCGDIAHTKTQISPEFVELCSDFLKNLADIAPTYIILGNHDGNLRNSYRQDAITPIVDALNHKNLHLLKDAGETHLDDKFCLNVLSVFDENNWVKPTDPDKINIGLYHGAIKYSRTDIGFVMEHGEHSISIFDDCDYAMLGDIHKTQILNKEGTIAYAGSTIQQNFGETDDKGMFIWDIQSKTEFSREKINFVNPKPFITIRLTKTGRIPKGFKCPDGARLRLVADTNIPLERLRRAVDIAKHRFKPESITFLNKANSNDLTVENSVDTELFENLRDEKTQQDLIKEYLKDYNVGEDTLNEVFALNSKYNKVVEESEDISRNVHWRIKKFSWDNLFNYGEGNSIDFDKLSGTVGIFGKNYSGKSSVIDALLYTVYNNTSKNIRKTYNIINQNKDYGSGLVEIEANNKTYQISRRSDKYVKKLKGKTTNEAKTQADFDYVDKVSGEVGSLNQTARGGTDKAIRNVFGDLDDFLNTSMSSQLGALGFINEGSTRRKEILAKFLDLEFFEKKFKLAKEDAADLRGALRRIQDVNYDDDIKKTKDDIFRAGAAVAKQKNLCAELKENLSSVIEEIAELENKLAQIPEDPISIRQVRQDLERLNHNEKAFKEKINSLNKEIKDKEEFLEKADALLETIDILNLNKQKEEADGLQDKIDELLREQQKKEKEKETSLRQIKILTDIPCGDKFLTSCKFIKDAHNAKQDLSITKKVLSEVEDKLKLNAGELSNIDVEKVGSTISNWTRLTDKRKDEQSKLTNLNLDLERTNSALQKLEGEIKELNETADYYEEHKEVLENIEKVMQELDLVKINKGKTEQKLQECENQIYALVGKEGALEQKLENLKDLKAEKNRLNTEYSAYDLFLTCMHSNGIAFDVIKKALPVINTEIAKVLSNIVEFEVFFENSENKLNILIKHPKHDPRQLETCSGAEKTLAAVAIRIALLNVSNMPKSNLFILDEPGTALDAENMEGFVRILDLVKGYFDVTLLITHIESLKDIVDMTIEISKTEDGYAFVNQ